MNKQELQKIYKSQVPVTEKMGIEVVECSVNQIKIKAPLSINHNHLGTGFGGSLTAMQALCCWSWLMNYLSENNINAEIVIHESHSKYIRPVKEDIEAICASPSEEELKKFKEALLKKSKARVQLKSIICSEQQLATEFIGSYVAILK